MPEISYRRFDTWTGFQNRLVSRRHILELTMAEHLDRYELRILALLQEDASRPTTEIAEIVGLSQAPCWRRIQRLKEAGYIKKTVCILALGRAACRDRVCRYG